MTTPLLPEDPATLGGHRLLARLGAGGMGQVYLARSPGGKPLAVKTVHAHLAAEPHFRERFRREATAARAVTGAYTAAVVDADPDAEQPWLATAYLPGVTLRQAVAAAGPLGADVARSLAACLAEALVAMHAAGVVHRDLKPSNVLLTADGPRVIDFGIARATGDHARGALTATGALLGTPGYMAPEQVLGAEVGPATDVFALGAVLTFATTGQHPFGTGPVAVLLYRAAHEDPDLSGVPEPLRALTARCLSKPPPARPTPADILSETSTPQAPLWWREPPLGPLIQNEQPEIPARPTPEDERTARQTEPVRRSRTSAERGESARPALEDEARSADGAGAQGRQPPGSGRRGGSGGPRDSAPSPAAPPSPSAAPPSRPWRAGPSAPPRARPPRATAAATATARTEPPWRSARAAAPPRPPPAGP
ncbi:serine/threonine-protein kinase [Streptomyces sp. G45]|uniref:serine/threonine-protein kinase n=1 Tax=Streptomyces sp. G45 TaxID=3406627 RepID=UPI003C19D976